MDLAASNCLSGEPASLKKASGPQPFIETDFFWLSHYNLVETR